MAEKMRAGTRDITRGTAIVEERNGVREEQRRRVQRTRSKGNNKCSRGSECDKIKRKARQSGEQV